MTFFENFQHEQKKKSDQAGIYHQRFDSLIPKRNSASFRAQTTKVQLERRPFVRKCDCRWKSTPYGKSDKRWHITPTKADKSSTLIMAHIIPWNRAHPLSIVALQTENPMHMQPHTKIQYDMCIHTGIYNT